MECDTFAGYAEFALRIASLLSSSYVGLSRVGVRSVLRETLRTLGILPLHEG
jgi:hypothetical protein